MREEIPDELSTAIDIAGERRREHSVGDNKLGIPAKSTHDVGENTFGCL